MSNATIIENILLNRSRCEAKQVVSRDSDRLARWFYQVLWLSKVKGVLKNWFLVVLNVTSHDLHIFLRKNGFWRVNDQFNLRSCSLFRDAALTVWNGFELICLVPSKTLLFQGIFTSLRHHSELFYNLPVNKVLSFFYSWILLNLYLLHIIHSILCIVYVTGKVFNLVNVYIN